MNPIEVLIKSGPNINVEFLAEIDEMIDFAKICVSFANNKGGSIFIGVNPKGKVLGVNPDPELKLVNQVNELIEGDLHFETISHLIKHHCIIEVVIEKTYIPLLVKLIDGSGMFYYRVDSSSVEANKIIERYLNIRRYGKTVIESNLHSEFINRLGENQFNLSILYKMMDLKPNEVDKLTADLLFLNKLDVHFLDKKFCYSRLKS